MCSLVPASSKPTLYHSHSEKKSQNFWKHRNSLHVLWIDIYTSLTAEMATKNQHHSTLFILLHLFHAHGLLSALQLLPFGTLSLSSSPNVHWSCYFPSSSQEPVFPAGLPTHLVTFLMAPQTWLLLTTVHIKLHIYLLIARQYFTIHVQRNNYVTALAKPCRK